MSIGVIIGLNVGGYDVGVNVFVRAELVCFICRGVDNIVVGVRNVE